MVLNKVDGGGVDVSTSNKEESSPLDRLYNSVSKKIDIGIDLNTFREKMSTPELRRSFYNSGVKAGVNLGDYDTYENVLADKTGFVSKIVNVVNSDRQPGESKNGIPMTGDGRTDFDRMRFDKNPAPEFKPIDPGSFVENARRLDEEFSLLKSESRKPETKEKSFLELYGEVARNEKTMTAITNLHESGVKDAAKMFNAATIDLYEKATSEEGVFENLAKGAGEGLGMHFVDYIKMWRDFGKNKSVLDLTNKVQGMEAELAKAGNGSDDAKKQIFDRLNPDEQLLLKSLSNYYDAVSALSSEVPYMRKLGEGLGESLGYMAEFAGAGGAGWLKGALKPAVTAGLKGVAAGSGKMGMDALSKAAAMGAERISMQAGKEAVKGFVPKAVDYAKNAPILMAEAAIQSIAMPTFYKDLGGRISSGESEASAFWNTLYNNAVENYSERIFVGAGSLGRLTGSAVDFAKMKGMKGIAEIALNTGEEYAEELIGDFAKRFPDWSEKGFSQAYSDYWADKGDTFASVALMTGLLGGASYAYNSDTATEMKLSMSAKAYRSQLPLSLAKSIDAISEDSDLTSPETISKLGQMIEMSAQTDHLDVTELYEKTQGYLGAKLRYDGFKSSLKDVYKAVEATKEEEATNNQIEQLQQFMNKSGKIVRATYTDSSGNVATGFILNQTPGGVNVMAFDDDTRGVIKSQDLVVDGEYTAEEHLGTMKDQAEQIVNSESEEGEVDVADTPPAEISGKMMYGDSVVEVIDKVQEDGTVSVQDEEGGIFAVPEAELKIIPESNGNPSTELDVQEGGSIPLTKDGAPDYDAMEPDMLAVELEKAMGKEFTLNTLSGLIEDNGSEIEKLGKKQGKTINEKIAIAKQLEVLKEKNRVLSEIVQGYNAGEQIPVQDGAPVNLEEGSTTSVEANQVDPNSQIPINEVEEIADGTVDGSLTGNNKHPEFNHEREYTDWVINNSQDITEILSAYESVKGVADEYNSLQEWQKLILGKKIKPDSFYRFGDRNTTSVGLKKSWLNKNGWNVDTLAKDLSQYGREVTEQDIVDFVNQYPGNYVRRISDEEKLLSKRFSDTASEIAGMKISGPESATGKAFVRALDLGRDLKDGEYKEVEQEELRRQEEYVKSVAEQHEDEFIQDIDGNVRFRDVEGDPVVVNDQFNEELRQQIAGELPKGHVYKLGSPSRKLLSAGIPNLPIELAASRLKEKSLQDNHPFNLSEIDNLPDSIHSPLAVFRSATHLGSFVVMTEIEHDGKNFVAAIEANRKKGKIEINDIRSIHYRTSNSHMANWIDEGLLDYVDKKRMSEWLSKQRYNSAEVKQLLGRATKIVYSFENPTILTGEISAEVDRMSEELGVEVNKVKNRGQLPDEIRQRMKNGRYPGLYDVRTGKVYVIMDEITDAGDAQATVLHEALAHKGLRGLFKKENDLNDFLDQVMDSMPDDIRDEYLNRYKQDKYLAAEEYVASFAETYDNHNPSAWEKLKSIIADFFRRIGVNLKLSDADLKYVLWKAKNRLKDGDVSLETAKKISGDRRVYGVLFRNADNTQQSNQEKEWTARRFGMCDLWRERMQDRMIAIKRLQDEIKKRGGKIMDYVNMYVAENLASSKSAIEIEKFDKEIYEPLMDALKVFVNKGKTRADIDNYLMAKHAPERNAKLKKETGKEVNSGLSDSEARQIVKDFEKDFTLEDIAELWKRINRATTYTVDKWCETGFIDENMCKSIKGMFKNYVPLLGFDDSVEAHIANRTGSGGTANLNKKAKGRESLADSSLAHILNMAHSAIIAKNKNGIKKNLADLMIRNPHADMYRIDKTYLVNTGTEENPNWIGQIERPAKELFEKGFAKESGGKNPGLFNMRSNQVDVWINGQRYVMTIHGAIGDKIAAAANGTNSVRAEFLQKTIGRLTRWMTKNYTSRSPEFFISNFCRDFGYAVPVYWMKGGNPAVLLNNMRKSFAVIHNDLRGKPTETEMQKLYQEFKENGGLTGYVHMDDIDVTKEKIERKMRKMMGEKTVSDVVFHNFVMTYTTSALEYCTQMSENSMRFAVYASEIQAGKSKQEAAYAAKEITTNFNRKGTLTPVIGSFVGFFNASVQGTYNGLSLAKHHPVKFAAYAGSMITLQYLASQLCRAFGGDDELGNSCYDRLGDYTKYTNFILPSGDGKFVSLPLPHFFRALMSLGVVAGEVTSGVKDPGEALKAMFGNVVGELSPVDGTNGLVPTALKPIYEAYFSNKDFMGNPISYDPYMANQEGITPQSALAPKSTNSILVNISKYLNRTAGGDDLTSAGITFDPQTGEISRESWRNYLDINPAKIEHVIEGAFGGRMKFANNVYKTIHAGFDSDTDVELKNVPVARRFYIQPGGSASWNTFYETRDHVKDIKAKMSAFEKVGDWDSYRKINTLDNLKECVLYETYEKLIRNVNDMSKDAGDDARFKTIKDEIALEFALKMKDFKGDRKHKKVEVQ